MEEIINQLAQRVGISPEQAQTVMATVSKTLLQKAEPGKAQGLLSKLPSGLTSMFSDNDKQQFTTTKQDISNEEVVQQIDRDAGINDRKKSQKAVEESVKLVQEKTGEEGLLDNVMGKFKNIDLNPFD
jgi:uncharacterized protein (DUF2267 family)